MLTLFLLLAYVSPTTPTTPTPRPLGQHAPPSTEHIDTIHHKDFNATTLKHYQQHNYPLVIHNAIKHWPAHARWTNDTALLTRLGPHRNIQAELSSKEDPSRAYTAPETWLDSSKKLNIKDFIQQYGQQGWYSAIDLPDALYDDISMPLPLYNLLRNPDTTTSTTDTTTNTTNHFEELNVIPRLWWSKGGTRSSLHYDPYDNLHCMVSGAKTFVLFPPRHLSRTHISDAAYFNDNDADNNYDFYTNREVSLVDVDAVDLHQFPGFINASFSVVTLAPGDCLFLPYFWMHAVRSLKQPDPQQPNTLVPNIAVSFWWDSWTSLLDLEWIGGLSDPTLSKSGDYIVGDSERLFIEFDTARRKHIQHQLVKDHSLFSFAVASGHAKAALVLAQQPQHKNNSKATAHAAQTSKKMLSYRWPKFIPVFMKSSFKKASILRNYRVSDQHSAAMALMWVYPDLPRLLKLVKSRNKQQRKQQGALAVPSSNIWLERQMCLLLGDIRGVFVATRRLRRRAAQGVVPSTFQTALDVLQMMNELADALVRGNVARILAAEYPIAKNSVFRFEKNCGSGSATVGFLKGDALSRTNIANNMVCGCVKKSGLWQQKMLREAVVGGTAVQLGGLLWSTLTSDFDCLGEYVLDTIGTARSRETMHTALSFQALDGLSSNYTFPVTTATSTLYTRAMAMDRVRRSAVVQDIVRLGGGGGGGGDGGSRGGDGDQNEEGHIEIEQVNYDGGWNLEPNKHTWSNRCDISVLSSWSTTTLHDYYQRGKPVLLLNALSQWDTTLRYLFTKESLTDNLWNTKVYPVVVPNEDALLFQCDGPACARPEADDRNGGGGEAGEDGEAVEDGEMHDDNTNKDKSCTTSTQTLASFLSNCIVEPDDDDASTVASKDTSTTNSQLLDLVPKYVLGLVNDAEQLLFGQREKKTTALPKQDQPQVFAPVAPALVRSPPVMHYIGPQNSGDAVTYTNAHEWNALLYGRKRWYLFRPRDAFATRTPVLEWLQERKEQEDGTEMMCEQPANSILLIPKGWARGNVHLADSVGLAAELIYEPLS